MADGTRQDVLGDLVALRLDQADSDIRAPQRMSTLADQCGVRRGLFGQIAGNRNWAVLQRPAGDERTQQALGGGQCGQVRETVGFVLEFGRQVRVEQQGTQSRRLELQRELTVVAPTSAAARS